MSEALRLTEIRRIIISYCDEASLACLARTWSQFTDQALNTLYQNLRYSGFYKIMKTLPRDSWVPLDPGEVLPQPSRFPILFTRAIRPSEWERFQYYSHRLKTLDVTIDQYIGSSIMTMLGSPYSPLFPNLETVRIYISDDLQADRVAFWTWINVFTCKEIKDLTISFPLNMAAHDPENFFYKIPTLFPVLESLDITRAHNDQTRNGEGLIYALTQLPSLRQLTLASKEYAPSVWETVVRLPSLRDLHVFANANRLGLRSGEVLSVLEKLHVIMGSSESSTPYLGLETFASSSLTDLEARGPSSFCLSLVKACASCPLRSLEIDADVDAVTDESTFLAELAEAVSTFSKLEALDFTTNGSDRQAPRVADSLSSGFLPLQRLQKLRKVCLMTHRPIRLSEEDARIIVTSWPALEAFRVSSLEYWFADSQALVLIPEECRLSLQSLAILAELSNLKDLMVPVKGPFLGLMTRNIVNKALTSLYVGSSMISSPLQVAMFLHSLFPCLQNVVGAGPPLENMPSSMLTESTLSWWHVSSYLRAIPVIRESIEEEKQKD